jgi:hypothetical protein
MHGAYHLGSSPNSLKMWDLEVQRFQRSSLLSDFGILCPDSIQFLVANKRPAHGLACYPARCVHYFRSLLSYEAF